MTDLYPQSIYLGAKLYLVLPMENKPNHSISYKIAYAPSEDSE